MATITLPYSNVGYLGFEDILGQIWSYAWGATITGEYIDNPYTFKVSKVYLKVTTQHNQSSKNYLTFSNISIPNFQFLSYDTTGSIHDYVNTSLTLSQTTSYGTVPAGELVVYEGSVNTSLTLNLHALGGKFRGFVTSQWGDLGQIYSTQDYPIGYVSPKPTMSLQLGSTSVNNLNFQLQSYTLTDVSSYTYTLKIYTDSSRTDLVQTLTGSTINNFPLNWNNADPGTTYYITFDVTAKNSVTGDTVNMTTLKTKVTSMAAWVNTETFYYTASPLYNNHWTPRTVVTYNFTNCASGDYATGLSFKEYELEPSFNGLYTSTKATRISSLSGTLSLTDTTKLLREAKPRDLMYIKIRSVCVDGKNNEFYSDWYGMLTGQSIYNEFHTYLTTPSISDNLRVNARIKFLDDANESYWNKGVIN